MNEKRYIINAVYVIKLLDHFEPIYKTNIKVNFIKMSWN